MNFVVEALAEDTLLLSFGNSLDLATNNEVHRAARILRRAGLPTITDIAPAYTSLLVRFDPFAPGTSERNATTPYQRLLDAVHATLDDLHVPPESARGEAAHIVEVPVCYGGDFGQDLAELAARAHLTPQAFIVRHTALDYSVAMLGFAPGFPYLLGLDPALAAPRRATPRTRVPTGSVAIGGAQTGIYPRALPGGWNLIGRTPLVLFDPQRKNPALLSPGDRVRFRAIHAEEFAALAGQAS